MYHPLRRRQLHFLSYTAGIEPTLPKENEATPEEALDLAYKDLRDDLATQLLAQIKSSHPSFFEKLVVDLMLRMGLLSLADRTPHRALTPCPSPARGRRVPKAG